MKSLIFKYLASLKWSFAFAEEECDSQVMKPGDIRDDNVIRNFRKNKRFE